MKALPRAPMDADGRSVATQPFSYTQPAAQAPFSYLAPGAAAPFSYLTPGNQPPPYLRRAHA